TTAIFIIVAGLLIGGSILFVNFGKTPESATKSDNVSIINGKQIIEIGAKGGYAPKVSIAKANIPTILKIQTRGTFDCSSALSIPRIGYKANLPPLGITEIEVPAQKSGAILRGLCAMGMYNFKIQFD
ncbi:MAG: hypothetical protein AAB696_00835, partial [Patescibacteria group bacterium]